MLPGRARESPAHYFRADEHFSDTPKMVAMTSNLLGAVSVGHVIDGRFPLLRQLGGSEWSQAYLTNLDDGPAQKAAIKIFPFESVDARATLARWEVARTLSHPHLMPLIHAARIDIDGEDLLYVVTEHADETLSQILPERPLTADEAREMLVPVLNALTYLHRCCLTHGHLRPTNIMVVGDQIKLSPDFGWRSRRRSIYDAPETRTGHLAPAADIWSLGILLVEALSQRPPQWDESPGSEPVVPISIPEPFFSIARECLIVDPERRCTVAAIKAYLDPPQPAEDVVEDESSIDRAAKPSLDFRAMILVCSVLALIFFIVAFKFGYDLPPSDPLSLLKRPAPAQAVVQPQPSVQKPPTPAAQPVPTALGSHAAPTVEPEPTAAASNPNNVARDSVMH
jgi:serine/threonine protein kinase